jgi:kynurenine formamidase
MAMSATMRRRGVVVGIALLLAGTSTAAAQDWRPLPPERRCPSRWGANDERGAANHMAPETVMRAVRLIKEGRVYELGRVLESTMPLFGIRTFSIHTARSSGPTGPNQIRGNEEVVMTQLGQVGTQFDALPHIGIGELLYNCVKAEEVATRTGFTKLGVDKVGALFTRGVLLDIAGLKGVPMLDAGYEITVPDLEGAMKRQNVAIGAGDAVFLHSGWGKLWNKDNAKYNSGEPGINVTGAEWLVKLSPMLVGADTWAVEVRPNPNQDLAFPVHQILLTTNGIFLLENMDLDALARDRVWEFAFILQPLKIKGGTGSTVAPIAVK